MHTVARRPDGKLTVYFLFSTSTIPAASVFAHNGAPTTGNFPPRVGRAGRRRRKKLTKQLLIIMALLTALQVQSTPNATLIIAAFIAFTAALYCVPMLFRFVKRLSNPAVRLSQPADDTVYPCHDEAFLHARP